MRPDLEQWLAYFQGNVSGVNLVDWHLEETLTVEECDRLARSLAAFQLGESSEGHGLLAQSQKCAELIGDPRLVKTTQYFIREEQSHALMLEKFMTKHGLPLMKRAWTDDVFRRLRRNVGYEFSITVLITAEIIALTYYRAVMNSTRSQQLAAICQKIIADETAHVEYESALIRYLRQRSLRKFSFCKAIAHRIFNVSTIAVVYLDHRQVLRAGGYSFPHFWRSCWYDFQKAFEPAA